MATAPTSIDSVFESLRGCPHLFAKICETFNIYDYQNAAVLSENWRDYIFQFILDQVPTALSQEFFLNRGPIWDDQMNQYIEWISRTTTTLEVNFVNSEDVAVKLRSLILRAWNPPCPGESWCNRYLPLVICRDNDEVVKVLEVRFECFE